MHERVIDDNGELIGENAIGAAYDEISYRLLDVLGRRASNQVGKRDDPFVGDTKAQGGTATVGLVLLALRPRKIATGARIPRSLVRSLLRRAGGMGNFGATAIAGIDQARVL